MQDLRIAESQAYFRSSHILSRFVAVGLACLTLLGACGCERLSDDSTRSEPAASALLGNWIPDTDSLEYMRKKGGYDTSNKTALVLEADGTYKMLNMPDWLWLDDGLSHKTLRSERGTWKVLLDLDRPYWLLQLETGMSTRWARLLGQHPPYRLRFSFGNIDTNPQSMTFIKEK